MANNDKANGTGRGAPPTLVDVAPTSAADAFRVQIAATLRKGALPDAHALRSARAAVAAYQDARSVERLDAALDALTTADADEAARLLLDALTPNALAMPEWVSAWPNEGDDWQRTSWLIRQWIPAGRVSLLVADGGAGKTRLALQIAAAVATGRPNAFLGLHSLTLEPDYQTPAPVVWTTWETAPGDFQHRLRAAHGIALDLSELAGWLHYLRATAPAWGVREGAHMATRGGALPLGVELLDYAERAGARLVVLDPLAGAFAGNENDRAVVRAFSTWLSLWAERTGCAILILAHPPKTAAAFSGSTDWRNGAQSLLTLKTCAGEGCELVIMESDKLNEGKTPEPEYFGWDDRAYTLTTAAPCEHGGKAARANEEQTNGATPIFT